LGVTLRVRLYITIFFKAGKSLKKGFPFQSLTQISLQFIDGANTVATNSLTIASINNWA
jgi:hypothetical protein